MDRDDPLLLTPEQRLVKLAELLANGLRRRGIAEFPTTGLEVSPETVLSVHTG